MDKDNIVRNSSADKHTRVAFKHSSLHSSFPAARFDASICVRSGSENQVEAKLYPGIPLSPDKLNEAIQHSELRIKSLELEFESTAERNRLRDTIEAKRIFWHS